MTFEQLPQAVLEIIAKVDNIEKLLTDRENKIPSDTDQLFTIDEAATFLRLAKATIYGLVNRNEIPYSKTGKRLYFSKQELLDWVKSGRKKTNSEIAEEANGYLNRKGK